MVLVPNFWDTNSLLFWGMRLNGQSLVLFYLIGQTLTLFLHNYIYVTGKV